VKARWIKPALFGLGVACVTHLLVIGAVPSVIMSIALSRMADQAGGWNQFYHAPRVTPQTQRVVRSSPDLAYSTCALDLSKGPVRAFVGKGDGYTSVALYSANTDNVFSLNDLAMGAGGASLLIVSARSPIAAAPGEVMVNVPSNKALLLVRRLVPDQQGFAAADRVRQGDRCRAIES
jgi:uncharacterized membrane protein